MFASVLRKAGIPFNRDDPYIEFDYESRTWKVQHFHSAQKGITINGKEHNMDLVIWSDNDYVAYVEVKDYSKDLPPHLSREFVGRVLWKGVNDALFVSKKSSINRWKILDRYGIRNTNHLLEAKKRKYEYREWPEFVVKDFIEKDLGHSKVKTAFKQVLPSRKAKTIELLMKHRAFNGVGFRFVEDNMGRPKYYYLSDEDYVIHAVYAIFIMDSDLVTVFKADQPLNLANIYEAYGSSADLGSDGSIYICPGFENNSAETLFKNIQFKKMTLAEIFSEYDVDVSSLPIFKWEASAVYPLNILNSTKEQNMPPCVRKALEGVPDGLFETAIFLQTVFKACSIEFDIRGFSEKCRQKIEEFWLSYEPSKTKKDTFEKINQGSRVVIERKIHPLAIPCSMDTLSIKGPKALGTIFHLELCVPDGICHRLRELEVFEYIKQSNASSKSLGKWCEPKES